MKFNRPDGKVGVRNEIWGFPAVGCVNNVAVASGEKMCSEKAGFHDFAIFKQGV